MSKVLDYVEENQETLDLYTKAITRAHGKNHPEVFAVHENYQVLRDKLKAGEDASEEFAKIRELTSNFTVPEDACETMAATYKMLEEADNLNS